MVWFGLDAEEYDRVYTDRTLVSKITRYFPPHARRMVLVACITAGSSLMSGLLPFLVSRLLGAVDAGGGLTFLLLPALVIFSFNFLAWGLDVARGILATRVINSIVHDIRRDAVRAVLRQDMTFFDAYPTSKLVSRINGDTEAFSEMASLTMEFAGSILFVVILAVPVSLVNPLLAVIFFCMVPVLLVFMSLFRRAARKKTLLGQRASAEVHQVIQESMNGIRQAKTFRQEPRLYEEFEAINKISYRVNLSRGFFLNLLFPTLETLQGVMLVVLVATGGSFIGGGLFTAADLYLFLQSLWDLFIPLFVIASFWPQFQAGMASGERIFALIDADPAITQAGDEPVDHLDGHITISNLVFSYDGKTRVFDGLSLSIKAGESVAIVGHTGAGKSSLAKLLLRLYEFHGGDITVDGRSIRDLHMPAYRASIGYIPQDPFLWSGTVGDNIVYGNEGATRRQVMDALARAGGREWLEDLPSGIDTPVRERGKLLSTGQRQLVAFARMLLRDPAIMILDEATASVDPFTETRLQQAMEAVLPGRTSIIIAHRLWTVRHVDRIIVLEKGKIIEEGSHDDLVARGGHYASLYEAYFKHQSYEFIEQFKDH